MKKLLPAMPLDMKGFTKWEKYAVWYKDVMPSLAVILTSVQYGITVCTRKQGRMLVSLIKTFSSMIYYHKVIEIFF